MEYDFLGLNSDFKTPISELVGNTYKQVSILYQDMFEHRQNYGNNTCSLLTLPFSFSKENINKNAVLYLVDENSMRHQYDDDDDEEIEYYEFDLKKVDEVPAHTPFLIKGLLSWKNITIEEGSPKAIVNKELGVKLVASYEYKRHESQQYNIACIISDGVSFYDGPKYSVEGPFYYSPFEPFIQNLTDDGDGDDDKPTDNDHNIIKNGIGFTTAQIRFKFK